MNDNMTTVAYVVYEGSVTRMERITKRLTAALLFTVFLLFVSNCLWLYAWTQYDYTSSATTTEETVTVDGKDGIANYIGNDGDITNGTDNGTESKNNADQNKDGE